MNGILSSGPGGAYRDGVLGSAMATGPGAAFREGSLGCATGGCRGVGEYFESGVSGLGQGVSIPTSMVLGVIIGAVGMYMMRDRVRI